MADLRKYVQGQDYTLAGAGIGIADTQIVLNSMLLPTVNTPVTMTMFGALGFATLEPETQREENISFTGIVQNLNGTATLTGVTRGLGLVSPYTQDLANRRGHAGSTILRITNSAPWYDGFANKFNDEDITGVIWTIDDPVVDRQIANKQYVDAAIIGQGIPATDTNPGISMEATQADVDAKTKTGTYMGNPYELFVNPSTLRATKYNDYVVQGGTSSAYTITPTPANLAYADGQQFTFLVSNTNTGATTLNVSGLGATPITINGGQALLGGELQSGSIVTTIYKNGKFEIQSSTQSSFLSQATAFDSDWPNAIRYNFGSGNQDTTLQNAISTRGDDAGSQYVAVYTNLYKKNNFGFYVANGSVASGSFGVWSQPCILTDKTAIVNFVSSSGSNPNQIYTINIHFLGFDGSSIANSNNLTLSTHFNVNLGGYIWCQTATVGNRIYACISGNNASPAGGSHVMVIIDISGTTATLVSETPFTPASSDAGLEPWFCFYKQSTSNTNILCHDKSDVTQGIVLDYTTGSTVATITGDVSNNYATSATGKGWFRYLNNIWMFVSGKAGTSVAGPYDNQLQAFTFDSNPNI